jgi:hypothetical protein
LAERHKTLGIVLYKTSAKRGYIRSIEAWQTPSQGTERNFANVSRHIPLTIDPDDVKWAQSGNCVVIWEFYMC